MLTHLVAALVAFAPPAAPQSTSQDAAPVAETRGPLDRIVVLGASMSAGFGLQTELDANFDLARTLELAFVEPRPGVHNLASTFLFQDPAGLGADQVRKAQELAPTLVIAVDFAFWYGYGYDLTCESRLARLEQGLQQLESFECPLLLGDLPDMRRAAAVPEGQSMLAAEQVPETECLAQLNARLHTWISEHDNAHLHPLAEYVEKQHADATVELRGNVYDVERRATLLQKDLLHPTYRGMAAQALVALDSLVRAKVLKAESVHWNALELEAAVWSATEKERVERQRKRAEREAKRKAREAEREAEGEDDRRSPLAWAG